MTKKLQQATFGAGCFWGVEEAFRHIVGVEDVKVGFMGGKVKNPTYIQVCKGNTGHTEVVHLLYNPQEISYEKLLEKFWAIHDPTQLNRQGPDVGSQYRSVVFVYTARQKKLAEESKEKLISADKYEDHIVTTIEKAGPFYAAEEYHQQYLAKHNAKVC